MANFALEKKLTKTLVLSRLTPETLENLLLNVLTECNYHTEVKKLQRVLPNAGASWWSDTRADKIARSIVNQLDYDAEACARVVVNADQTGKLKIALKYIGMGTRLASVRVAGTGLKAVQALLPGTTDRQANHFLHAFVSEILQATGTENFRAIEGEIEVFNISNYHGGHNPRNIDEEIDGVIGGHVRLMRQFSVKELERSAKMSIGDIDFSDKRVHDAFCDALTKNLQHNVLQQMDEDQLDEVFGEPLYQIERDLPRGLELNYSQTRVADYELEVTYVSQRGGVILVTLEGSITFDVYATRD